MRTRISEASIAKAREKADGISEKMRQLSEFLDGFDAKFWAGVTQRIVERIAELKGMRQAGWRTLPDAEIRAYTAVEKELEGIIDLPAKARAKLGELRDEHNGILDNINERIAKA